VLAPATVNAAPLLRVESVSGEEPSASGQPSSRTGDARGGGGAGGAASRAARDAVPVSAVPVSTSAQESLRGPRAEAVAEASPVPSRGALRRDPHVALEREIGTVLDVRWHDGKTYRGDVVQVRPTAVLVHYECDHTRVWHNFDKDGCSPVVVEPAAHTLSQIRRTEQGYDGKVVPMGKWYAMEREHVEETFQHEHTWLNRLQLFRGSGSGGFEPVRVGARRAERRVPPYCVLGSLAKAFHYAGDHIGAKLVEDDCVVSMHHKNRMKYAAARAAAWRYEARKVQGRAIDMGATERPKLLQVSRTHALTLMSGMIFDYAEARPLPLTRENLTRCIGAPYADIAVRGYEFVRLHRPRG